MPITDDEMKQLLPKARQYSVVLLHPGPNYQPVASRSEHNAKIIWEHGRRNFDLRAEGKMALVGPGAGPTPFAGMAVFTVPPDEVRVLMDADPAVAAGLFVYEVGQWWSFPGDGLPAMG